MLGLLLLVAVTACGGGGGSSHGDVNSGNLPVLSDTTSLVAAVSSSPYASVLSSCVKAESDAESCRLSTLPFLGQDTDSPDIDDVMSRVVVSHTWMAIRFRQLLEQAPPESLVLMKSLTAFVISADIRPSYYSSGTGAIYLDPAYLWLTNSEKATIDKGEDFRSDFGNDLSFVSLARYVRGNDYAWEYYDLEGNETRTIDDILLSTVRLLYHELAHANDFFPSDRLSSLDRGMRIAEASSSLSPHQTSSLLANTQPLNSALMFRLASILYDGVTATTSDRAVTPVDVGLAFEIDGASDDYGYSSVYEDTAMIFEEAMMAYYFGVAREIGYTDIPQSSSATCNDHLVRWGLRHRTGSELVKPRVETVLQSILHLQDVSAYLSRLETPIAMTAGLGWCDNLTAFGSRSQSNSELRSLPGSERALRRDDHRRAGDVVQRQLLPGQWRSIP